MNFNLLQTDPHSEARAGRLTTDHGDILTPVFMPVGTAGSVKGISQELLQNQVHAPIILGNTYHLYLRPGIEVVEQAGGLHQFINWPGALLTDSGGYQVFSLSARRKIEESGYIFQSHIDGSKHTFTPEKVVDIQRAIGSDIMMALDECTPYPCEFEYAQDSLNLTERWLKRGLEQFNNTSPLYNHSQAFFPIVQGSTFKDLRKRAAEFVGSLNCEGNAIGGLSVGEPEEKMYEITGIVNNILPKDKPRYLMGVGTPANIIESIALGIDMFDCVMPTRNGRNGMIFTAEGILNIKNEKWKTDFSPVDPSGCTIIGGQYSRAYLRHLIVSKEIFGAQMASLHNLEFYSWLMNEARKHILDGSFSNWKDQMIPKLKNRL